MSKFAAAALLACFPLLAACSDEASPQAEATAQATDAAQAEPAFYVGRWAADPSWCTDQSEGFPITLETDRFLGRENTCEMNDISENPEGGWTAQLSCVSEGTTTQEPVVLSPAGEQLAITYPERSPDPTLFSRCE